MTDVLPFMTRPLQTAPAILVILAQLKPFQVYSCHSAYALGEPTGSGPSSDAYHILSLHSFEELLLQCVTDD